MNEKYIAKRNSIKRIMIRNFTMATVIATVLSIVLFFLFIEKSINLNLVEINIQNPADVREIFIATRVNLIISIVLIIVVSAVITTLGIKKIVKPINDLKEATKKVANGDYNVKLDESRDDEIGELSTNFNIMVNEIKKNEALQREFINNVSHEIKTPFSSIVGFAELLKDDALSKQEREEYANIIIEESSRITTISNNMLNLSKLENQDFLANKTEIRLDEQIRKAVAVLEPKWREKSINIDVDLVKAKFECDEDLLLQVWTNILDNSIKYSAEKTTIKVKLEEFEDKIKVIIKDEGIGMTEEEVSRIFNKFYQADTSHNNQGAGLGMAITRRIVELHRGKIYVLSEKGKGSEFVVELP